MEQDQTAAAAGVFDERRYLLSDAAGDDHAVLWRTFPGNGCDGADGGVWKYFGDFGRIFQGQGRETLLSERGFSLSCTKQRNR